MVGVGKVYENRLRQIAERQGLRLIKSRRRDPRALDYGGWRIVDTRSNGVVAGNLRDGGMTLAEVAAYLQDDPEG